MWITRVCFVILLVINHNFINGKRFETRCKLARELIRTGKPNDSYLGQWVCLIEKVSKRDTAAYTEKGGKKFYGLYQIPGRWCREGKRGGACNVRCESLLDDDIRDDTACAMLIFQLEGFQYWTLWTQRCKNDNMITSEIYKCPDLSPRTSPERVTHSDMIRYRRMLATRYRRTPEVLVI